MSKKSKSLPDDVCGLSYVFTWTSSIPVLDLHMKSMISTTEMHLTFSFWQSYLRWWSGGTNPLKKECQLRLYTHRRLHHQLQRLPKTESPCQLTKRSAPCAARSAPTPLFFLFLVLYFATAAYSSPSLSIKGALSRWCLPLLNKLVASSMICNHEYTQHLIFCWGTGGSQHIKNI